MPYYRGGTHTVWNPRRRDRKSTRLNSSHTVISYAVFCLKKKNKADGIDNALRQSEPSDHPRRVAGRRLRWDGRTAHHFANLTLDTRDPPCLQHVERQTKR